MHKSREKNYSTDNEPIKLLSLLFVLIFRCLMVKTARLYVIFLKMVDGQRISLVK